ncbi:hypothetical protein ACLBWX_02380 [Methylobacterium sp. M6A4_1b]
MSEAPAPDTSRRYIFRRRVIGKNARNDRIRYRATFLNTIGTSLVMLGFFLPGIRLYDRYDYRLTQDEALDVIWHYFQTEPGVASLGALTLGFALHLIAIGHLGKLED